MKSEELSCVLTWPGFLSGAKAVNWSISLKQGLLQALRAVHAAPEQEHSVGLSPVLTAAVGSVQGLWPSASGGGRLHRDTSDSLS